MTMTAAGRQDATGGASAVQLFNAVSDPNSLSLTVTGTVSGWVFARPFTITIDPNTPSEEKCLCASIAGSNPATIAVLSRGADGTVPTTHGTGAVVTHTLPAGIIMDLERHVYDTSEDDHTQYLTTARHATPAKHEFGTPGASFAFGAGATTPADVGATADAGSGTSPARDDHAHALGDGAVSDFAKLDASIVGVTSDISTIVTTALPGVAPRFARADHAHTLQPGMSSVYINTSAPGTPITGQHWWDTTKKRGSFYDGTRFVPAWGALPYCHLISTETTAIPDASVTVWNVLTAFTAQEDVEGLLHVGAGIRVPVGLAGLWEISAGVRWGTGTGGRRLSRLNCSTAGAVRLGQSSGDPNSITMGTVLVRLAASETAHLEVSQDSTGTRGLDPADDLHYFKARFLQP